MSKLEARTYFTLSITGIHIVLTLQTEDLSGVQHVSCQALILQLLYFFQIIIVVYVSMLVSCLMSISENYCYYLMPIDEYLL